MSRRTMQAGKHTHTVCDMLKAVRGEFRSAAEVAAALGYANSDNVRIGLVALEAQGLVEAEERRVGITRQRTQFYRVAPAWRRDA